MTPAAVPALIVSNRALGFVQGPSVHAEHATRNYAF